MHAPSLVGGFAVGVAVTVAVVVTGNVGSTGEKLADAIPPATPAARAASQPTPRSQHHGHRKVLDQKSITINWVGDVTLGSRYGQPPDNARGLFADVTHYLKEADLTIGNLEGTLSTAPGSKCPSAPSTGTSTTQTCFAFQAPPANAAALRQAGFDVMNLANNHALDFGPAGQDQTIRALNHVHIRHDGLPSEVTTVHVHGLRVAIIGFAPYSWATSLTDITAARALVTRAAHHADLVIAIVHAGAEGSDQTHTPRGTETDLGEDRGNARSFAHQVMAGGADLVLGSGPHVIRGMELYRRRLIAYSLGNFAGDSNFATGGVLSESAILHVQLRSDGRLEAGRWVSVQLTASGTPTIEHDHASGKLMSQLSHEDFGSRGVTADHAGNLRIPHLRRDD